MIKYIALFSLALVILHTTSLAQKISIVASGSYLPNYSMTPIPVDVDDFKYSTLYSYGLGLIVNFTFPINFNTGIEFFYGRKDKISEIKPEPDPYAPVGIGPVLGGSRDIQWLRLDIPIMYQIVTDDYFTVDAGIKIGIGNLKQIDRLIDYDVNTGAELSIIEGSCSQNAIFYSPTIEFSFPIISSLSFIIGIEYITFEPKFEETTNIRMDLDPYPFISGNNSSINANTIHSEWKWHLTGIQCSCSISYSF